jgi:uncharacterized protein
MRSRQRPIKILEKLVAPPDAPFELGMPALRSRVERSLATALPSELYAFACEYGSGCFRPRGFTNVLRIFNPFSRRFLKTVRDDCRVYRRLKRIEGNDYIPYAIYPEKPGLLPCGTGEGRRALFWLTEGPPEQWPLVLLTPEHHFHHFKMSLIDFLVRLFSGRIDCYGGDMDAGWFRRNQRNIRFIPDSAFDSEQFPRLHQAASLGDTHELRRLLRRGDDPNKLDGSGRTALHVAIENVEAEAVRVLLDAGADPNIAPPGEDTPLHAAVNSTIDANVVKLLLEKGAQVDAKGSAGMTPLAWAANYSDLRKVALLLEYGADVKARSRRGRTPLSMARHNKSVRTLLLNAEAMSRNRRAVKTAKRAKRNTGKS